MNKEIEARFLEINKKELISKLNELGAHDKGEVTLKEIIFYDKENRWPNEGKFVRIRSSKNGTFITYKHNKEQTIDSAAEIEFSTSEPKQVELFLENIGLVPFRHQEKLRHTFMLNDVTVDIDTWPKIPTYIELEGASEESLKVAAELLGLAWEDAVFEDARAIIQNRYNIPVRTMRWFTFNKFG